MWIELIFGSIFFLCAFFYTLVFLQKRKLIKLQKGYEYGKDISRRETITADPGNVFDSRQTISGIGTRKRDLETDSLDERRGDVPSGSVIDNSSDSEQSPTLERDSKESSKKARRFRLRRK